MADVAGYERCMASTSAPSKSSSPPAEYDGLASSFRFLVGSEGPGVAFDVTRDSFLLGGTGGGAIGVGFASEVLGLFTLSLIGAGTGGAGVAGLG
jgi:hypothetical protein